MPWWALGYVIIYAGIGVAAAIDEYRSGNGLGWAVGELLATALGSLFVWALWQRSLQSGLGNAVVPLFVGVLVWEIVSAAHDLSAQQPNPEPSTAADRTARRLGVLLALLLVAPALAAGALLCWRALNA